MPTRFRRWRLAEPAPARFLNQFAHLPPLLAQVLYNRGLTDPQTISGFLDGCDELGDPFQLCGMQEAVARLRRAIRTGEPIAVYGDFDADGVTATALLVLVLRALGGQVQPYIPHRVDEGYGLNHEALSELASQSIRVVVTVDCGVRSIDEVAHARRLGMDVIVTDHHTVGPRLPDALAVIDPRRLDCTYPDTHLAGVGLAFKLGQALLRVNGCVPINGENSIREADLLDLVALGTVADLAPLVGENRCLVQRGLERINAAPRPGVEALMRQASVRPGCVDESTIGFALAPRLNAAGRIAHAKTAYQLLTTDYPAEAEHLARELDGINRDRQRITAEVLERALGMVSPEDRERPLLFLTGSEFPAGVVGLVASRLLDEFYRPVVVVEQGEQESRGSCRSIPEFHITEALDACADLLVRYGGHRAAAGFTVRTRDLLELERRLLAEAARHLAGQELSPALDVDAEIPLGQVNWDLLAAFQRLRPFGEGNREPLLLSRGLEVRRCRAVGSDGAHLKLALSDGWALWDGIAFRQGDWIDRLPERIDVAYHVQDNEWNGERRLQLNIQDIRLAGEWDARRESGDSR